MKAPDPQMRPSSSPAININTNGSTNGAPAAPAPLPAPPPLPPALSSPPSLETIWYIVRRRWLTILCLGVLAAGLAFAAVWTLFPGKYTASRNVRIAKANRGGYESEESFTGFVRAQTATLKSPDVIRKVVDQTSIQELNEIQSKGDAKQWLQDKLVTDTLQSPEILRVSLAGDNPEELATILDEVVRQYVKEYKTREKARAVERAKQLNDTYKSTAEALRDKRIVLNEKLRQQGMDDPGTAMSKQMTLLQQVSANQTEAMKLRLAETADKGQLLSLKASIEKPETIAVSPFTVDEKLKDEPTLKPLYEELIAADKLLNETRRVAATNPEIPKLEQARKATFDRLEAARGAERKAVEEKVRRKVVDDTKENIAKMEAKLKTYGDQQVIVSAEIAREQSELAKLKVGPRSNENVSDGVAAAMDDVTQTEMVWKKIGEELGAIQVETSVGSRVEILDEKVAPTARKVDTQAKYAGVASLVTFGLVFFGVVFWEYGHRRVYTSNDVTRGLNLPLLGTLPLLSGGARRGVPAADQAQNTREQNAMIEAVDAIRTSVLYAARTQQIHVVMVTSPGVGEGKTTLACHLAASLARGSRNTLLIDCDLRNPAANRQFDLPNEPGLSEALRGEIEFEEAILSTPVARLSLLPAGKADRLAIQCLAQENIDKVFHLLREHFEFIVIDVPPVLPVADSLLIGQHADAVVFSVMRNVSRLPALHAAQQKLSSLGVPMLGAVVIGEHADAYDYPAQPRA